MNRECHSCGSDISIDSKGSKHWTHNQPTKLFLCKKCANRIIYSPPRNKIMGKKDHVKRIVFMGKRIYLKYNPRKGICLKCGNKGLTNIHHIEYHQDDPLKDTIELCASCHRKEHLKKL